MLQGGQESLTDRQADRQTDTQTDRANPIYPLTSLRGYKKAVMIFKPGSIWGTKIRNEKVSTTIKKISWPSITIFPDFTPTFPHPKIFLEFFFSRRNFSQNSLIFPWPWKIKIFPDCWQPCRNICSQKLEHLNTGFLWTMPHALKWYSHMVFVWLPLLYYLSSNIVVFRSQKRF